MIFRIVLLLLLLVSPAWAFSPAIQAVVGSSGAATDYCAGTTWNTFTAFRLDFDHTTDTKTACLASGTQVGELSGTPGISTPLPLSIGSGGNALITAATDEHILFDASPTILKSQYGELMVKLNYAGNSAANYIPFYAVGVTGQDRLLLYIDSSGATTVVFEDHNHGDVSASIVDLDGYYGDWILIHAKWDTTRCTDGTCNSSTANGNWTQAGEDELCVRYKVDANNDGSWDADWSAWSCETSAIDMGSFASEPGVGGIQVGLAEISGVFDVSVMVDDLEISITQPSQ